MGDTRELSKIFFETIRIKNISDSENDLFSKLVDDIAALRLAGEESLYLEEQIEKMLAEIYTLSKDDLTLIKASLQP